MKTVRTFLHHPSLYLFLVIVRVCELQFQSTSIWKSTSSSLSYFRLMIADYNNDNLLDIMFFCTLDHTLHMLHGYGNGTFKLSLVQKIHDFSFISIADFNHDKQLDIVSIDNYKHSMHISFGNVNGTFEVPITYPLKQNSFLTGIVVADFNNDNHSDIAVTNTRTSEIVLFIGNGNGTFSYPRMFSTGNNSSPSSIAASDFNDDHCLDIVVVNTLDRNIGILLGHCNGTFDIQMTSFTGGGLTPYHVVVDDFNNDVRQDILLSYTQKRIGIMFGHGNGSFSEIIKLNVTVAWTLRQLTVADFNKDGHQDIVVAQMNTYSVIIFLGDGKGNFIQQTLFSTERLYSNTDIAVGDFNRDGYQDIIAIDIMFNSLELFLNTGIC